MKTKLDSIPFIVYVVILIVLFVVALTGCYTQRLVSDPVIYVVDFYYPWYYPRYNYYPYNYIYYRHYEYTLDYSKKYDNKTDKAKNTRTKGNQDLRNKNGTRNR